MLQKNLEKDFKSYCGRKFYRMSSSVECHRSNCDFPGSTSRDTVYFPIEINGEKKDFIFYIRSGKTKRKSCWLALKSDPEYVTFIGMARHPGDNNKFYELYETSRGVYDKSSKNEGFIQLNKGVSFILNKDVDKIAKWKKYEPIPVNQQKIQNLNDRITACEKNIKKIPEGCDGVHLCVYAQDCLLQAKAIVSNIQFVDELEDVEDSVMYIEGLIKRPVETQQIIDNIKYLEKVVSQIKNQVDAQEVKLLGSLLNSVDNLIKRDKEDLQNGTSIDALERIKEELNNAKKMIDIAINGLHNLHSLQSKSHVQEYVSNMVDQTKILITNLNIDNSDCVLDDENAFVINIGVIKKNLDFIKSISKSEQIKQVINYIEKIKQKRDDIQQKFQQAMSNKETIFPNSLINSINEFINIEKQYLCEKVSELNGKNEKNAIEIKIKKNILDRLEVINSINFVKLSEAKLEDLKFIGVDELLQNLIINKKHISDEVFNKQIEEITQKIDKSKNSFAINEVEQICIKLKESLLKKSINQFLEQVRGGVAEISTVILDSFKKIVRIESEDVNKKIDQNIKKQFENIRQQLLNLELKNPDLFIKEVDSISDKVFCLDEKVVQQKKQDEIKREQQQNIVVKKQVDKVNLEFAEDKIKQEKQGKPQNIVVKKQADNINLEFTGNEIIDAVSNGKLDLIQKIISMGKYELITKARSSDGMTALMLAIDYKNGEMVTELLKIPGIDVNEPSGEGWTPLMLAANQNNVDIVEKLLNAGAKDEPSQQFNHLSALDLAKQGGDRTKDVLDIIERRLYKKRAVRVFE